MKKVVIALGGNALQARGEAATSENQLRNVMATAEHIARIIGEGYEVIISHGNGPQVGRLMLQNEAITSSRGFLRFSARTASISPSAPS